MNEKAKKYVDLFRKVKIASAATLGRASAQQDHQRDDRRGGRDVYRDLQRETIL